MIFVPQICPVRVGLRFSGRISWAAFRIASDSLLYAVTSCARRHGVAWVSRGQFSIPGVNVDTLPASWRTLIGPIKIHLQRSGRVAQHWPY